MSNRRRKGRPVSRAWREAEISDEGELLVDLPPARCPRCCRPVDLGGLDDIDVHRCGFCRTRTRWLWSDRRDIVVAEIRGPNPDWWEESWDELYRGFYQEDFDDDFESDGMFDGEPCANGCEDPVFGGPASEVQVRGEWVCAVCGCRSGEGEDDEDDGDSDDDME